MSHAEIAMRNPTNAFQKILFAHSMFFGAAPEVKYKNPAIANSAAAIGIAITIKKLIVRWISSAKSHARQLSPVQGTRPFPALWLLALDCDCEGA